MALMFTAKVPKLADQGIYLGSEATMYRILREQKMNKHRLSSQAGARKRQEAYIATGPNQVWSWDIKMACNGEVK